ncbi:hypothetical protein D3C73_1060990 [compost metagenome]
MIVKDGLLQITRELLRHEGELHQRLQPDGEQKVKHPLNKLKIIDRLTLSVLVVHHHVIIQQAVHLNILEPDFRLGNPQRLLHIGQQHLLGPAYPNKVLKMMAKPLAGTGSRNFYQ